MQGNSPGLSSRYGVIAIEGFSSSGKMPCRTRVFTVDVAPAPPPPPLILQVAWRVCDPADHLFIHKGKTAMERQELVASFDVVRSTSEKICRSLVTEDYVIQSMTDVSPPKWHLAHTAWFFGRVILQQLPCGHQRTHPFPHPLIP